MTSHPPSQDPSSSSPRSDARGRILDVAETEFADHGFAGASLRRIAEQAGVAAALVHYHFGGKEGLFDAVVERRAEFVNRRREEALAALPDAGLEEVLYALMRPAVEAGAGGSPQARIVAAMAYGGDENQERVRRLYDPTAHRFIAAIRAAAPGLDMTRAARGYVLAVAAMIAVTARPGRVERLAESEGEADLIDALGGAVIFAAGGIRALEREARLNGQS